MNEQSSAQTPAQGWYTDPNDAAQLRWWDGSAWTDHVHPPAGGEAAATASPAAPAEAQAQVQGAATAAPAAATPASTAAAPASTAPAAGGIVSNPAPAATSSSEKGAIAQWFGIRSNQVLFVILLIAIALFIYVMAGGA